MRICKSCGISENDAHFTAKHTKCAPCRNKIAKVAMVRDQRTWEFKPYTPTRLNNAIRNNDLETLSKILANNIVEAYSIEHEPIRKKMICQTYRIMTSYVSCTPALDGNIKGGNLQNIRKYGDWWSENAWNDRSGEAIKAEHTVPVAVMSKHFIENKCNYEEILTLTKLHGIEVAILKSEDEELRKLGLSASMPDGWKIGDNTWARYNAAGISPINIRKES